MRVVLCGGRVPYCASVSREMVWPGFYKESHSAHTIRRKAQDARTMTNRPSYIRLQTHNTSDTTRDCHEATHPPSHTPMIEEEAHACQEPVLKRGPQEVYDHEALAEDEG